MLSTLGLSNIHGFSLRSQRNFHCQNLAVFHLMKLNFASNKTIPNQIFDSQSMISLKLNLHKCRNWHSKKNLVLRMSTNIVELVGIVFDPAISEYVFLRDLHEGYCLFQISPTMSVLPSQSDCQDYRQWQLWHKSQQGHCYRIGSRTYFSSAISFPCQILSHNVMKWSACFHLKIIDMAST